MMFFIYRCAFLGILCSPLFDIPQTVTAKNDRLLCGFRKVLHYDEINRLYKCVPCGRCPVGYKLNYKCNSQTILSSKEDVTTNRCLPCNEDPHHITAYSPGGLRCFPCKRSCGINGEIERPCSLGKNTQCRCKFNYYRHPITGKCLHQCIKCPEGRKFELVNQECVNYNNGKDCMVDGLKG